MSIVKKEELLIRLTEEFKYPKPSVELVADKILNLQPSLQTEFQQWWRTGDVPTIEIEGYTTAELMSKHGMNPIAALLTLDWLIREPEKAKASLKRGHDQIIRK